MATATAALRMPEDLAIRYDRLAKSTGRTKTFYMTEALAAEVRRYEGAGRAERGTILDSIAARCAGAARAARAAIEELGDRIWALMRPRKAQRGERSLDDVMREATEAARASEALSRNHVAPTNSSLAHRREVYTRR